MRLRSFIQESTYEGLFVTSDEEEDENKLRADNRTIRHQLDGLAEQLYTALVSESSEEQQRKARRLQHLATRNALYRLHVKIDTIETR